MDVKKRVMRAVEERFREVYPRTAMERPDYVDETRHNFREMRWLGEKFYREMMEALSERAGLELRKRGKTPPRINAVHSSTALALNTLAPWIRDPDDLRLARRGHFRSVVPKADLTVTPKDKPENVDILAAGFEGVVAVESRFLEIFDKPRRENPFGPAYSYFRDKPHCEVWHEQVIKMNNDPLKYRYVDARRIVTLALAMIGTYGPADNVLLYLYWEPENWESLEDYRRHRQEVEAFRDEARGSPVRLEAMSYTGLLVSLEDDLHDPRLRDHLKKIRDRYVLPV